jgi:hypothetical protein
MLGLPSNTSLPIDEIGLFPLEIKTLLEQNLKKKDAIRTNLWRF